MMVWAFDSQDLRKEPTGFQGRYTHVAGITGKDFPTQAAAEEAMQRKARHWRLDGRNVAGFDVVYRHRTGAPWFLCLRQEWRKDERVNQ